MVYRREIDGLRALAVLPVILFHAGFDLFQGGFAGVDVFFVISGYLITSIILSELEQDKFSIVSFYERRARRILPALFVVMALCIPFAWLLLLPPELKDFSESLAAVSLFSSNILFWRESGYFDTVAELKPLLHTWSLAVEEQFYLIFPVFLVLTWRVSKRCLVFSSAVLLFASLGLAQWASIAKPAAAFFLLPTRGWELLIGSFAALYLLRAKREHNNKPLAEIGASLGLLLILYAVFAFSKATPFPGFYALVPTMGTFLIILFASQKTMVGRLLGNRLLVTVGLMSYSAYLWHQPLFAFARICVFGELELKVSFALIVLTFVLSWLSLKFVEAPFRRAHGFSRRTVFLFSGAGIFIFFSLGAIGHFRQGFSEHLSHFSEAINDWRHPGSLSKTSIEGFYKADVSRPIDILFFGDSHAEQFAPLSEQYGASGKNIGFLSGGGCPPIPNLLSDLHPHCFNLFDRLDEVLRVETTVKTIVIAACFNCYFITQTRSTPDLGDHYNFYFLKGNERLFFRRGEGQAEALDSFTLFLRRLSSKVRVVVIGDNPAHDSFSPSVILAFHKRGESIFFRDRFPGFSVNEFEVSKEQLLLDSQLRSLIAPEVSFLSLYEIVCPGRKCRATDEEGKPIYKDTDHMRPAFVQKVVAPHIMKLLE